MGKSCQSLLFPQFLTLSELFRNKIVHNGINWLIRTENCGRKEKNWISWVSPQYRSNWANVQEFCDIGTTWLQSHLQVFSGRASWIFYLFTFQHYLFGQRLNSKIFYTIRLSSFKNQRDQSVTWLFLFYAVSKSRYKLKILNSMDPV